MELEEVLRKRASIRQYNDRMPDEASIRKILDAALLSPVVRWHKLHLSVVTSKEVMRMAEEAADQFFRSETPKKFMYDAPVWIILSGELHKDDDPAKEKMRNDNLFWNVGSIIENIELEAVSLGLAGCGMNTTVVAMKNRPDIRKAAGIPDGYDALGSVIVGYSDLEVTEREVKPELIPVSYIK